jgi:hypothetical protein
MGLGGSLATARGSSETRSFRNQLSAARAPQAEMDVQAQFRALLGVQIGVLRFSPRCFPGACFCAPDARPVPPTLSGPRERCVDAPLPVALPGYISRPSGPLWGRLRFRTRRRADILAVLTLSKNGSGSQQPLNIPANAGVAQLVEHVARSERELSCSGQRKAAAKPRKYSCGRRVKNRPVAPLEN